MNTAILPVISRILCGCLCIICCTQFSYTLEGGAFSIPITGQSFGVLLVAYLLGGIQGSIAVGLYLLLGAVGLPVFAEGKSGVDVLLGASGGFLYGFLLSTVLTNLAFRKRSTSLNTALQFMMLGTLIILCFGAIHLSFFTDWDTVFRSGIRPFLPGAAVKIIFGAVIAYSLERYLPLKYFRFVA